MCAYKTNLPSSEGLGVGSRPRFACNFSRLSLPVNLDGATLDSETSRDRGALSAFERLKVTIRPGTNAFLFAESVLLRRRLERP